MTYEWRPSDHAFEAFLASCGDRFEGDEKRMYAYFKSHPGESEYQAIQKAMVAYARKKMSA